MTENDKTEILRYLNENIMRMIHIRDLISKIPANEQDVGDDPNQPKFLIT